MDPEIEAMSAVATALEPLEAGGRTRVLKWALDRFEVTGHTPRTSTGDGPEPRDDGTAVTDVSQGPGEQQEFEHFADLFDAAGPRTRDQKVLVAGYWFQKIRGQATFQSLEVNRELSNLGHKVDHIADVLGININKRPALVLQVKKSGSSQQARKTYKLSVEGMRTVEKMIAERR